MLNFLKWQSQRWADWDNYGKVNLAAEYRRNISKTIDMYMLMTAKSGEEVISDVGQVSNHSAPTLDVIFPDWFSQTGKSAAYMLRHAIKECNSVLQGTSHEITKQDIDELIRWIEENHLIGILWFFDRLDAIGFSYDVVSRASILREIAGLCISIEHLVDKIGEKLHKVGHFPEWGGLNLRAGFSKKIELFWKSDPEVSDCLEKYSSRMGNKAGLDDQFFEIDRIPSTSPKVTISKDIFRTIRVRNHALHRSMVNVDRDKAHMLIGILLRSIALIWKHAKVRGL